MKRKGIVILRGGGKTEMLKPFAVLRCEPDGKCALSFD